MARFQAGSKIRDVVREGDDADARRAFCERQLELLAQGFHRVRDPAREPDHPDDPRDPGFEQTLHDNPDDAEAWLVYADHFVDRGHVRGPLMALEAAPVQNIVQRAERAAVSRQLHNAAGSALTGYLARRRGLSLEWRRGFINTAHIHGRFLRGDAEDLLFDLLRHPSARFLRELRLSCWHEDAQDHRLLLGLILNATPAPPLRLLGTRYDQLDWDGYQPLGHLGALGTRYPLLEDVFLEGDDTTRFTGLSLPRAKRFAFVTAAMSPHTLRPIAAAPWPALEDLELSFHGSECTLDALAFLFQLRNLTRLRIRSAPFANELARQLLESPLAKQLKRIELRGAQLDSETRTLLLPYDPYAFY